MIAIENLCFAYGRKPLFGNLDLSIGSGLYGLLGKNGAGKTTLLKILSGLLFPDRGSCEAGGFVPGKREPDFLSSLFYLPEEFYLPGISGRDYVSVYAPFYPGFEAAGFENCVSEFGIDTGKKLSAMSYGQKKQFLISFGLSTGAKFVFLDEPSNGLDIPSKSVFRRLSASASNDSRCIIISTHQVRDMEGLIDPVVIVDNGKIIFNQSLQDISEKLSYFFLPVKPDDSDYLYIEKLPGGWGVIRERDKYPDGGETDLEVLFNAVAGDTGKIRGIFSGGGL